MEESIVDRTRRPPSDHNLDWLADENGLLWAGYMQRQAGGECC